MTDIILYGADWCPDCRRAKTYLTENNIEVNEIEAYQTKYDEDLILKIKRDCRKQGRKFFLSNNLKLAKKLDLDGAYFPSFNNNLNFNKNLKKKFIIIGSAHSIKEIKIKEQQGVKLIFLSPIFRINKSKKFLGPIRFNLLAAKTNVRVIALGGINQLNINKLNLLKNYGFAGISYFINHNNI